MAKYILEYIDSALEDLEIFKRYEQVIILDTIDEQLLYEPDVEVNNRKPMEPNKLATWELRIGVYRVFYDVDQQNSIVKINAVGYKEHNILFLRGKEYML